MKVSFFLLLMLLSVVQGLDLNLCRPERCGRGPIVRFPFRLREKQPEHCGYPGFELSCKEDEHTELQLPNSVKLYIQTIDYVAQELSASDPSECFARNAKAFHLYTHNFEFPRAYSIDNYALFNCSLGNRYSSDLVSCLGVPGSYEVYAFAADNRIDDLPLTSCRKMYNISSVPSEIFDNTNSITLTWSKKMSKCRSCEIQGGCCGWKDKNIACFDNFHNRKLGTLSKTKIACEVLGPFLLVLAAASLFHVYWTNRKEKEYLEKFLEDYRALKPTRYSFADLKRITNQFKDKLGQGSYGTVFKGKISNEIYVAIKILNNSIGNGEEFINEVGTMGRIHHVNVVRLVGFCADGFKRALVYEFLPNESLEKFIFSSKFLGWEKLEEIALGIARGIEYLHQGCDQRILHFDIKPHNILLDDNFNPKVSDFGLAKLCSLGQSSVSMTAARGTMGYIAPEVFSRNFGNVSYKSDVYSFGMVLFEMVGGRKNIDANAENDSQVFFPEWIYNQLEKGEELRIRNEEQGDSKIAKKLTTVALWCIQWYPVDRPSIKRVVQMLEGERENIPMPPNPFASAGSAKMNVGTRGRRIHQELEVISEVE
ncbi:hypothetical protein JCGZ_25984 [Jatropha curcas]|uniref:Protein kinase domain-containing protein n=1 Tax=Jatropha curcas TaxID=180498 RepID=A0A067JH75_JATCU|nr:rust resistance kinase Lr10 [Jatropha curcas]KDP22153.1 hypothetical protein JCGZ_25984 [Jatropha curcas]